MTTNRATRESTREESEAEQRDRARTDAAEMIDRVCVRPRSDLLQRLAATWRVFAALSEKYVPGSGGWRNLREREGHASSRGEVQPYVNILWIERVCVFLSKLADNSDAFTEDEIKRWDEDVEAALASCSALQTDLSIRKSTVPRDSVEHYEISWLIRETRLAREVLDDARIATAKALGRQIISIS